MSTSSNNAYLTTTEASRLSGMHVVTIYQSLRSKRIPGAIQIEGGQWRIPRAWAEHKLAQRRQREDNTLTNGK